MDDPIQVRACEHEDIVFLQRIKSPILSGSAGDETEALEVIFLFTRPHSESAALLKSRRSGFRQAAMLALEGVSLLTKKNLINQIEIAVLSYLNGTLNAVELISESIKNRTS